MEAESLSVEHAAALEERRKIPSELACEYMSTVKGNPAFNYLENGALAYRKILLGKSSDQRFARDRSGVETVLFNVDCLKDASSKDTLIVTEGEFDALSFLTIGAYHVVSVPDGAQKQTVDEGDIDPAHDTSFSWLWKDDYTLRDGLDKYGKIILATDNDKPGQVLRRELADRLGPQRCYKVAYPDDCKDASDVLVKHGEDALSAVYKNAKPWVPDGSIVFSQLRTDDPPTFSTGFEGFDPFLKIEMPSLGVITGTPGSGKSIWALCLGLQLAFYHKLPGTYFSFEGSETRIRKELLGFAIDRLRGSNHLGPGGQPVVISDEERERAAAWLDNSLRIFRKGHSKSKVTRDIAWLRKEIEMVARRYGHKWIIVDPWNQISHFWTRSGTEAHYLDHALQDLHDLATDLSISLWIVAHPTATGGRVDDIEKASLYDINGGAAWYNKVDYGVILQRPDKDDDLVYVKSAKTKDTSRNGVPGIVSSRLSLTTMRYKYIRDGV